MRLSSFQDQKFISYFHSQQTLEPFFVLLSLQRTALEHFLLRETQHNALILCFCRNFYPKTGSRFLEIAPELYT